MITQKIKVWTMGYFPFTMGGNMWRPMWAELKATGPHDLGKGFKGFLVIGPGTKTAVAEAETGGIVGKNLKEVKKNIADCKYINYIKKQVEDAKKKAIDGVVVTPNEFWTRLLKARQRK